MLYRGAALSPAPLSRTDSRAEPGSPKSPGGNLARPSETCPGDSAAPSPGSLHQSGFPQPPSRSPRRPARTPPGAGAAFGTARGAGRGWKGRGERAGAASRPQPALRRRRHLGRARAPPPRRKWRTRGREGSRGSLSAQGSARSRAGLPQTGEGKKFFQLLNRISSQPLCVRETQK